MIYVPEIGFVSNKEGYTFIDDLIRRYRFNQQTENSLSLTGGLELVLAHLKEKGEKIK